MKPLLVSLLLLSSASAMPMPRCIPPPVCATAEQTICYLERQRAAVVREREINRTAAAFMEQMTGQPMDPFFAFWIDEETHAIQAIDDTISVIKFGHIEWRQ